MTSWLYRRVVTVPARLLDWMEVERDRFALWLPVAMAVGCVGYFSLGSEPAPWLGGAAMLLCVALALLLRGVPRAACWAAAALALGFASAQFAAWRAPPLAPIPSRAVIATGIVAMVEALPQGQRVTLEQPRLDGGSALNRRVRIRLHQGDPAILASGDRIQLRALLMRPSPPAYPGGWDLQRDAYFAGMAAYGYALAPVTILAHADPAGPSGWLQRLRGGIAARIAPVLPTDQAAIATTLLTGAAALIPAPDRAAFRDSGLAHLLAIAGLHIGIVMGLVFGATRGALALSERAALRLPVKQIAAVAALLAGAAYMLLTGAHVPILRSFAMAAMVTLAVLVGRRALSLRGLALAMACLLLLAPAEVMGVSFQMSFSAVLALVAGYAALRPALSRLYGDGSRTRRIASHIVALALTSALAGTASAPFAAYHFGRFQLYFVVANMLAVPITAMWVMPAGLIALALMPLHLEALALVPMGWGIDATLWIARIVSSWPDAVLAVPSMPAWGLAITALGIAWLGLWRSRMRLAGLLAIAIGLASPILNPPPDLLVSADARLIALRRPDGVFVQRGAGASRFTLDAWQQYWAADPTRPLDAQSGCGPDACRLPSGPLLLRRAATEADCAAPLLISAEPIRLHCPSTVPMIDRFTVWRDGAQAVWLTASGPRVLSDRAFRGDRPWVAASPGTGISPGLVPALSE